MAGLVGGGVAAVVIGAAGAWAGVGAAWAHFELLRVVGAGFRVHCGAMVGSVAACAQREVVRDILLVWVYVWFCGVVYFVTCVLLGLRLFSTYWVWVEYKERKGKLKVGGGGRNICMWAGSENFAVCVEYAVCEVNNHGTISRY